MGNKYNGYYYNTKTTGKTEDALTKTVKAKEIGGQKVDDNAVVILYTDNGASKKITGKQFNALSQTTLTANDAAYGTAFTKDVNGLCRVLLASVKVNSTSISGTSYDNYGYIVSDGSEKANGDISFTMWNGSENVDVLWENGEADKLVKGTLVAYSSVDDNKYVQDGEVIGTLEQIQKGTAPVKGEGFTASQNRADDSKTISVDGYSLDVTADTKVLALDTDAAKSEDIGQPYNYGDKIATAAKKGETSYCYNVVYRIEDGGSLADGADLDLLVVDVTSAFNFDKPGKDSGDQGSIDNDIKNVQTNLSPDGKTLTVAFDVPKGTTDVTIDFEAKVSGIVADSGTKSISGITGTQASFTIDLSKVPAASKDDVTLSLSKLVYTAFSGDASATTINEALKQKDAKVKVGALSKDDAIEVPQGATLDLTSATIEAGAKVSVAAGGSITLPNGTKVEKTTSALDLTANANNGVDVAVSGSLTSAAKLGANDKLVLLNGADVALTTEPEENATITIAPGAKLTMPNKFVMGNDGIVTCDKEVTIKQNSNTAMNITVPENATVIVNKTFKFGTNDVLTLGNGAKVVGASEGVEITFAGTDSIKNQDNFYQSNGSDKDSQVQSKTYKWTTDKWIATT